MGGARGVAGPGDGNPRKSGRRLNEKRQAAGGRRSDDEPEVVVLGGGPAGCAAAALLGAWGVDVAWALRPSLGGGPDRSLAESLPPSCRRVLAATGFLQAAEAAGLHANTGNTALWRGERRNDDFGEGASGFHVLRSRFDGLLQRVAASAGARIVPGTVRRASRGRDGWLVDVDAAPGGERETIRAPWALDCTGRAGVVARGRRVAETEAPTLAVVRRYESERGWDAVNPGHAVVESFERGWAWSVPTSERRRHVAVMLDPELGGPAARDEMGRPGDALDAAVARTSLTKELVAAARPDGPAWAVAASMYSSSRFAADRALFVGDAGSFVDPMSSFGVKKALASGWLSAVAVHTALRSPELEDVAVDYFRAREREMYGALRRALAVEVAGHGGPGDGFWQRRAAWLADDDGAGTLASGGVAAVGGHEEGRDASDALRDAAVGVHGEGRQAVEASSDATVESAFRALREGSGRLELGTWRETRRPMVEGNRIRMAAALLAPRFPDGVRYLRGVHVLQVARMAAGGADPGVLYERYSAWAGQAGAPPAGIADFLAVLATLVADGVLRLSKDVANAAGRPSAAESPGVPPPVASGDK